MLGGSSRPRVYLKYGEASHRVAATMHGLGPLLRLYRTPPALPCAAGALGPSSAAPSCLKNQRPPRVAFEHAPRSLFVGPCINKGKIRGSGGRMPGSRAVYGPSNLHDSRMLSATRTSQVSGWCGRRWPPPLLVSAASIDIYATCRPGSARGCRRRGPPSVATWHTRPEASRRRVSGESAQVGGAVVGGRPPSAATWHTRPPASSSK
jgi:hypothetical protein